MVEVPCFEPGELTTVLTRRHPWRQLLPQRRRLHDHLRPILPGYCVCPLLAVWRPRVRVPFTSGRL